MKICVMNESKEEMWMKVPVDSLTVKEVLGPDVEIGEDWIKDHEFPFDISEEMLFDEINKVYEEIKALEVIYPMILLDLKAIIDKWFKGVEEFIMEKEFIFGLKKRGWKRHHNIFLKNMRWS